MKHLIFLATCLLSSIAVYSQEICNNGIDDDFDGFIDCYDGSCAGNPQCDGIFLGNDATCQAPPPVFPKFTMSLDFSSPDETTNHLSRMAIGDLNRDGVPEIVTMNRYTKKLFILNGNNGSIKAQTTVTWEPYWEVAIANLDNDNCGEIFFIGYHDPPGKNNNGVYMFAYDCNLNLLWTTAKPFPNDPINFGIADFDGDGQEEIYAKDEIYDAKTGVRLVKSTAANYQRINGGPVAANITGDSKLELILGLNIYQVNLGARTVDAGSLALLNGRAEYFIRNEYNATSVADYNLDGFLDVIASGSTTSHGSNTTVFLWDVQNNTLKTFSDPQPGLGSDYTNGWINGTGRLNIADLDGNGKMNASYVSGRFLYALDENFNLFWRANINEETSGYTGCTLFDFNGDGKAEIVYRDERFLYIIEGTDGSVYSQQACISRTNREYPIVADVDADGSTELCVTCGFNDANAAANFNTLSYSRYSHIRVFKSAAEPWVPARRVWNQHGYFVVNVNDDLTIPKTLQSHHLVFSTGNCTQGPNRPLNKFLNQAPYLNSEGCPTYASADLAFLVQPTIIPPTCPNLNFTVSFKLTNLGDVAITGTVPVTFYTSNPKKAGATKLNTINITANNLQKDGVISVDNATVTGIGSDSLYVVLNDAGTTVPTPIKLPNTSFLECDYDNIRAVRVNPFPVSITGVAQSATDQCSGPNTGVARAYVPNGPAQNTTDYNFYWSNGTTAKSPATADYVGAVYSGIPAGTYTVYAKHKTASCNSDTTQVVIGSAASNLPAVTITVHSDQTSCSPLNGKLEAVIAGGGPGYQIAWYDQSLTALGITGPIADNLAAGSYVAVISRGNCNKSVTGVVEGPAVADGQASVTQHVIDCSNPNSGAVSAAAIFAGVIQNPANFTFTWHNYDNATATLGSVIDPVHGTGPNRTGLPVGYYKVVIKDNASQCLLTNAPPVQITSTFVFPDAPQIQVLAAQTSCDPANPNGSLTANVSIGGVAQNPASFTFEWFKGQNTLPANKVTTVSDVNGKTVNQVAGGGIPYTVKVTSANNCSATADLPVPENIINPVVNLTQVTPNSVCDPASATSPYNGSIRASVTFGGNPVTLPDNNYTFVWRNPANAIVNVADNKNPVLAGLQDGNAYSVTVMRTDLSCPSNTDSEPVTKATILPQLSATSTGSNNCDPTLTPDGTVTVTITNTGASPGPFTFQWYDGNAAGISPLGGANNGTSATAIKLGGPIGAPKPYTVEVLNTATGCRNNTTQFVADNGVVPVLTTSTVANSICSPSNRFAGEMTVGVTNIPAGYTIADYNFVWYDGGTSTTQHTPQPVPTNSIKLTQLDAGTYSVIGTNTKTGCVSAIATNQVGNTKLFPQLVPSSTGSNNCDSSLTPDGTASVAVSVALGPFNYQWYLGSGDPIAGSLPVVPLTNNGQSQTATKLGGPVGAPVSYTVLVSDQITGCRSYVTTSVADNGVIPTLSTTTQANAICTPGAAAGSMTVSVTNIPAGYVIGDYTFQWYDGNTNTTPHNPQPVLPTSVTLAGLDVGSYSVVGTNTKTGCISALSTNTVGNTKLIPALATASVGSHNCDAALTPDGTASVNVTVAAGPFNFQWYAGTGDPATAGLSAIPNSQGGNSNSVSNLGGPTGAPHAYTVLVTDQVTGCSNYTGALVADISQKPTFTLTPSPNHVCAIGLVGGPTQFDGSVTASAVNHPQLGTSTISYTWYNVDPVTGIVLGQIGGATTPLLLNIDNGKYAATVKVDDLGCVSDPLVREVLDDVDPPAITPLMTPNHNCTAPFDGRVEVSQVDGINVSATTNFTYNWYNGATVSGPSISTNEILGTTLQGPANSFTVEVMNRTTGCKSSKPVTLVDNTVDPVLSLAVIQDNTICDITIPGGPTAYNGVLQATVTKSGAPLPVGSFAITWGGGAGVPSGVDNIQYTQLGADPDYTAFVVDNSTRCQSAIDTQSIVDNLTYPSITLTVKDQSSCSGSPNGRLTAAAGAGVTYTWFDGIGTSGPTHVQTAANSGIIDQLASTNYTVRARIDATACASTETRLVPQTIINPTVTFNGITHVNQCSTPNGEATASITGLSAPMNYDIYYVYTTLMSGAPYPTLPNDVKTAVDPTKHTYTNFTNQTLAPAARTNLMPGYLTALVVDRNTLCESSPATQQLNDNTTKSTISLTLTPSPGLCGGGFGGIDATVGPLAPGAYTYEWYTGAPTNATPINFFNNLPAFGAGQLYADNGPDLGVNHLPIDNTKSAGTYTLVVRDANGCGAYHTDNIPTQSAPVINVAQADVTRCDIGNGQLDVHVTTATPSGAGYSIRIFSGTNAATGTPVSVGITGQPVNTHLIENNLAAGPYFIRVTDEGFPGCPVGESAVIVKKVAPPVITVDEIKPNTSCSTAADGKVDITVTNANGDVEAKDYDVFSITPPIATLPTPFLVGVGGDSGETTGLMNGFKPASSVPTYTIKVRDQISRCEADLVAAIPEQQSVPSTLSLTITPETACSPLSNGTAVAALSGGEATTMFDFTWAQSSDMTGPVYSSVGDGTGTLGELLNRTHATAGTPGNLWTMGANGNGSGNRTYYLQATKNNTALTGVGCKTAIVQVVIPDQHMAPNIALTSRFDSFCLANSANNAVGDGEIDVVADANPALAGQQIPVGGFNYDWSPSPVSATVVPIQNSVLNTYTIDELHDGTYSVTATNVATGCSTSNDVDVLPAPYVIRVASTSPIIDQRICNNDGWIQVNSIALTDHSAGGNSQTTSNAAIDPLYDFEWYANALLTAGTQLRDAGGAGAVISERTLSNDVDQNQTVNQPGDFHAMKAGTYYVVATRTDDTQIGYGCASLPFQVIVNDKHVNPLPALTPLSNTSCNPAAPEGEILVNVSDATAAPFNNGTYAYTWSVGNPTPIGNTAVNNGNGSNADADGDHPIALKDGVYTVTIANNRTGCSVLGSTTIIKNATPVFVTAATPTPQVLCGPDGSISVQSVILNDRTGAQQTFNSVSTPNISDFDFDWTRVGAAGTQTTIGVTTLNVGNYNPALFAGNPAMGQGTFTVAARRRAGTPGAGCTSAPFTVVIQDKRVAPVVTLTPFANTSCNPAVREGEITVKVTDNSTAVGPAGFTYTWSGANPTAIASAPFPATNDGDGIGTEPDEDNPKNLLEGSYAVTVQSNKSLCTTTASTTIFKNSTPVFTQLVIPTDQVLCMADGKLAVNEVRVIDRNGNIQSNLNGDFPLTDFVFRYDRATLGNTILGNGHPSQPVQQLDNINYPGIGADTYFVVATRVNNGPGAGCFSAPYQVTIQNKQILPIVQLTPFANTSCDPTVFEGEIEVKIIDNSVNLPAPLVAPYNFNYTYNWTASATPGVINGAVAGMQDGDAFGGGEFDGIAIDNDGDHPQLLREGGYALSVLNNQTGCLSKGTTTIFKNSTPVFTQLVVSTPQVVCTPDGSLQVQEVKLIDRNGNVQSNLTGDFLLTDFAFRYDRATLGNTVINNAHPSQPVVQLDNTTYSSIGFDSYYVIATRISGGPGMNCPSAPYKVDIIDNRSFPNVDFTSVPNSSCSALLPNGSIRASASEQNGVNTDPYTFSWTLNGIGLATASPTSTQNDLSPNSDIGNALDGNYVITATNTNTGCAVNVPFSLIPDQTLSTPNIIDVSTVDPLDCNPTGSATVTKITLGSAGHSILYPPNIPPNNEVTGPGLNNFDYEWYAGSVGAGNQLPIGGPFTVTPTINNIDAGTYFVVVHDPTTDCRSGVKEVIVDDANIVYPVLSVAQTAQQISCMPGVGSGALAATADGQNDTNPNYAFEWFSNGTNTPPPFATTSAVNGLVAGMYSVRVQNLTTSCATQASYIVTDDQLQFTPIVSTGSQPRTLCVGLDGAVTARVLNMSNTYPFTYNATTFTADLYIGASPNLANPPDIATLPLIPGFNGNFEQQNLDIGVYTIRIKDNNTGCIGTATAQVREGRIYPTLIPTELAPVTNCDPLRPNGVARVTANGVVSGYSFEWYEGNTVTGLPVFKGTEFNEVKRIPQQYTVRGTELISGCFTDIPLSVSDKTVAIPAPIIEVLSNVTSCVISNGALSTYVGDDRNTKDYIFDWSDGTTEKSSPDYVGEIYTELAEGKYSVTATSIITGCKSPLVTGDVLIDREYPDFDFIVQSTSCDQFDGYATVVFSSNAPVETIEWTVSGESLPFLTGPNYTDAGAGVYTVKATTFFGCETMKDVEIKNDIRPYNGISRNGDDRNDFFQIDCIQYYEKNIVKIFNRAGTLVYEAVGYDNSSIFFNGRSNRGISPMGENLPDGTYYFIVDKRDGSKPVAGYLEIVK